MTATGQQLVKTFLGSERRAGALRRVGGRVARKVGARRPAPPPVRPATPSPPQPVVPAVAPYRTLYDADYTKALIEAWTGSHPEQAASTYFTTHAGRFAVMVEIIRRLGVTGACLDVGGTAMTEELFLDRTSLSSFELSPKVDLEIEQWADAAGLGKFELVTFLEVVEHLNADPSRALHEINRCLVPGGHVIVTTVNIGSERGLYNLAHGEAPYAMANLFGKRQDRHQREYAPKELARLVAAHGFETWATTVNVYPNLYVRRQAHEWVGRNLPAADGALHGDTIVVVGRKVRTSQQPRRIHPIYHETVSENSRDTVPPDVAELVHDGLPPALAPLLAGGGS